MLLGKPPFDGDDSYAVGYKHVHEQPVAPSSADPKIPIALSNIIVKCLAKSPAERYDRGFDLADALNSFLGSGTDARSARAARRTGFTPT